ncbi:MAG: long-chain-fatty-acid--CoA ligase, partial [Betaproteobacteria bacterium RIFCSPLOWO2_12_FULL_62_13]
MRKIWLDSYPAGIPPEVDVRAYSSLEDLLTRSCRRFHDKTAFVNMGAEVNYNELDRLSRDFGAFLQNDLGLSKADRVAIMLPNLLQYPVALFGALRAGMTVVNVNPLYTASELEYQLFDSGAKAIVVLENFAHTLERALAKTQIQHIITTRLGDLLPPIQRWIANLVVKYVKRMVPYWDIPDAVEFREALAGGAQQALDEVNLGPEDIAFLQYTGGTTGRAKGAILTHGNMVANVEQTAAWIGTALKEGEETVITALPLYHIFALTANLLVFVKLGGKNVLITNPRDIPGFVAELKKTRFTAITGVNTLFSALLDAPGFNEVCAANRNALKVAVAGGMAVQRAVAERWQRAMGAPLIEGYGLTEASPIVCANPFNAREFSGKLGLPVPSTDVAILNEHGDEVALGALGEICVRGPQVMRSYWNVPEETAQVFTPDGWLRTGDIGCMDHRGFVEFVDRRKDVIVVSGFKAYPTEIEDVVMLHPGVKDAGAVGVPDERSGEAVVLFVVRKDAGLTAEALLKHCAGHLTGY